MVREPYLPKKVHNFKQLFPIHLARRQLELVGRRVYVVKDLIRPPQRPAGLPDAQEGDVQTVTGYVLLDLTRQRKRKTFVIFPRKTTSKRFISVFTKVDCLAMAFLKRARRDSLSELCGEMEKNSFDNIFTNLFQTKKI